MYSFNTSNPTPVNCGYHGPAQPLMAPPQHMIPMQPAPYAAMTHPLMASPLSMQSAMAPSPYPIMPEPLMAPPQPMMPMQPTMVPAPYPGMTQSLDHMGFAPMVNQPMMAAPMPQPMMYHPPVPQAPMVVPPPPQMVPTQCQPMTQPPMGFVPLENQGIMAPMAPMTVHPPPQVPAQYQPMPQPQMVMVPMEHRPMMAPIQQTICFNPPPPMPVPPPHMYQTVPPPHIAPIEYNQQMIAPNGFASQQAPIHHNGMIPQPVYMEPCAQPVTVPHPGTHQSSPMDSFTASAKMPTTRPDFMPMNHSFVTLPPHPTHEPGAFYLQDVSQPTDFGSPPPAYDTCPPSPIPPPPGFASHPPLIRPYSPIPGAGDSSDYGDDLYEELDFTITNDEDPASPSSNYSDDLTEDGDTAFLEPPFDSNDALLSPSPSSHSSEDFTEDADTAFLQPPSYSCPSTPPRCSSLFSNPVTASSFTPSYVSGGCTFHLPASSMDSESSPSTPSSISTASTALSPYAQSTSSYGDADEGNNYDHDASALADYLGAASTSTPCNASLAYSQSTSSSNNDDNEDPSSEDALEDNDIEQVDYNHDSDALADYLECNMQLSEQEGFEQDDLSDDCPSARAPSTTSVEDDDSSLASSWSSSSIVHLSSSGSDSVDEDAISVSSYTSSHSFRRGGCTFYPPPPPPSTSDSESNVDDEAEPRPLDDVQQLLQPSSAHSILRQFRPESQRDVDVAALNESEAAAYIYASFNRPVGKPQFQFTAEEIDDLVSNQLRMAREPSNTAVTHHV